MAIKVRVLYYSNKGKMISFADAICAKLDCKSDSIPPGYPCENERLVILGISCGKEIPDICRMFVQGLNKTRAHNVAIFMDGPKESAMKIKDYLADIGTKTIGDVYYVKGGLPLKFLKSITEEERAGIVDWALKIYNELNQ
ncbi:MAG: hypothetical protein FWF15_06025 [Oscillospiraceae bacterium]|nr:hypothetical protein [Oscillospiraceae bacterium]